MSPRRAKKQRLDQAEGHATAAEDVDFEPKPQLARRARGKRGGLAVLPTMPVDVICEILGYLHPKDLLNVSRASKDFRKLLTSRTSAWIWRMARELVDLPPCPDDMSEPAYANLMFCFTCHGCGKGGCTKIYWECRVRYCNSCCSENQQHYDSHYFREWNTFCDLRTRLLVEIPFPLNFIPIYIIAPRLLDGGLSLEDHPTPDAKNVHMRKADIAAIEDQISKMSADEVYKYITARAEMMRTLREQTVPLILWRRREELKRAQTNEAQKSKLRQERLESIERKLIDLGYEKELDMIPLEEFRFLPEVAQAKALTERMWKNIEPQMLERVNKLRREALKTYNSSAA